MENNLIQKLGILSEGECFGLEEVMKSLINNSTNTENE
jgi:hypothetical protein